MLVLHIADIHLDSDVISRLGLPERKRDIRKKELRQVFRNIIELAREKAVDAVLVAGDLWNDESVSPDTVAFLGEQFRNLGDIPVFIAPGNHDFYAPGCGYDSTFWEREKLSEWPSNIHIFKSGDFEQKILPDHSDVAIVGRAFRQNVEVSDRLLKEHIERPEVAISILLFHGSRLGHESNKQFITSPFDDDELLAQDFSYTALGHYHKHQLIEDSCGYIRAAYPGCPAGRTLGEDGKKGVLLLEVEPDGVNPENIEFVNFDKRRIFKIQVDLSGSEHRDAMEQRIEKSVNQSGAGEDDIVYVQLTGRYPPGIPPDFPDDFLTDSYWHVRIECFADPDYDLEGYRSENAKTVEARFAREILSRLDATEDRKEYAQLREALYLGLDAIVRGKINVREFTETLQEEGEP